MSRIRVLVSNDDGIFAPGLVALVSALGASDLCEVLVSAPAQERSASSHAITLGQHISAVPVSMHGTLTIGLPQPLAGLTVATCGSNSCLRCVSAGAGAAEAYAVDGKPADCTMLALHGPLFQAGNHVDEFAAAQMGKS